MRDLIKYNEFLNEQIFGKRSRAEPFFYPAKRKYIKNKEEIERNRFEQERQQKIDNEYNIGIEKSREQRPLLKKCIDILKNHPEK
jgi:hypothetical protein